MSKKALIEVREQIQEDLLCLLDGASEECKTNACQIVVDRIKPLLEPKKRKK
jgi:hypothetical protein